MKFFGNNYHLILPDIQSRKDKGEIMFALNQPDSARYYFDWNKDVYDIYGRAARYNGLYQVEKKLGNCGTEC